MDKGITGTTSRYFYGAYPTPDISTLLSETLSLLQKFSFHCFPQLQHSLQMVEIEKNIVMIEYIYSVVQRIDGFYGLKHLVGD
jgi:hypothetical protein